MDPNEVTLNKAAKLNPVCPGSTDADKHSYSLKSLVDVHFTEEAGSDGAMLRVCPSCKKTLTNSVKVMRKLASCSVCYVGANAVSSYKTLWSCYMQALRGQVHDAA